MADVGNKKLLLQNTIFPKQKTYSPEYNTEELRDLLDPESPIATDNVIQMGGIQMLPEQPETDTNFLGSLIAQGAAGIGTGLMGGSASDIQRSSNLFDRMREADINRQNRLKQNELLRTERLAEKEDRLKQNELLRTEKLAEKQAKLSEFKTKEDQEKRLADPNSDESIRERLLYEKVLKTPIPKEVSAYDLKNNKELVRSLISQAEQQPKLTGIPIKQKGGVSGAGGGVGKPKPEKEVKSNEKSFLEYRNHVASLSKMEDVINNINKLNRTRIGRITPDFSTDTEAYSSALDRDAQDMVKTLAGPGTLQPEERATYGKLVPTGNTRSDLALRQAKDIIISGTKRSLDLMNSDLNTGRLNKKDYDALINQYNDKLTNKNIAVNQVINPATGQLELREKKEAELKDGKKVLIDQFGYTWE